MMLWNFYPVTLGVCPFGQVCEAYTARRETFIGYGRPIGFLIQPGIEGA